MPVSINALMVTLVDHAAHHIWDYGAMEREIRDEEWTIIEYYAIQLAAAGPRYHARWYRRTRQPVDTVAAMD